MMYDDELNTTEKLRRELRRAMMENERLEKEITRQKQLRYAGGGACSLVLQLACVLGGCAGRTLWSAVYFYLLLIGL